MGEGGLELLAALLEKLELTGGEGIEVVTVRTHEMAEHGTGDDGVLMLQAVNQFEHIIDGVKAEAVHACVKLDMYGPSRNTFLAGCLDESIQQTEGVDLRLKIVVEHGLEGRHLGIHNHDVGSDACLAEGDTLVGHRHSEIVHTMVL